MERFLLSAPLQLEWAGWTTTTHRLQQAGWRMSVDQAVMCDRMRIMMTHSTMRMQAMTDYFDFQFRRAILEGAAGWDYIRHLIIPCQAMGGSITIHCSNVDWSTFKPIDAEPQFAQSTIHNMEDLVHFGSAPARTNEIILPEEDVSTLMERILKMQDPSRQKRFRDQLRVDRDGIRTAPSHKFHAQIISLAA